MDRVRDVAAELGRSVQQHKPREDVEARALQHRVGGTNANIASERDIIMAYRLILGREPENSTVVQNIKKKGCRLQICEILSSDLRSSDTM
jgi:hypothetical protein